MPTWTSPFSPFRRPIDADIRALEAAVQRTKASIAEGGKRGRALGAVAARFGVLEAARLHWSVEARWRVAVVRAGGGPGAGRYVDEAVNRLVEERGLKMLTAA